MASPAPAAPVVIRAVQAWGVCPLGHRPGLVWRIGPDGRLSTALCRSALKDIQPLLATIAGVSAKGPPHKEV